ncbi:hypothetical protein [Gymnodinialimonas ulvae]|uniref:hypothetical protein n=1 Tax=Gymnodinialimonas ulvae TaxID=3126504 RepID=UPI00309D979C
MTIHAFRALGPAALLRATAPRLAAMKGEAAADLITHLRNGAPALSENPAMARALIGAVATLAPVLHHRETSPEILRDTLGPLADQLRDHGLAPRGYIALRAAFLSTIARCLGPDPALLGAWDAAIGTMLATMMTAAHGPRAHTTPLAA